MSIAQSLAVILSKLLSGKNFSFRNKKKRKKTALGGISDLLIK